MALVLNIQQLCRRKSISILQVERDLGFGKGSIYKWDTNSPSIDKIQKVADYFNVSTDYIVFGFYPKWLASALTITKLGRSLTQFANDTGINEDELHELCAGTATKQPSLETLQKIINDNTFNIPPNFEIVEAAGYDPNNIEPLINLSPHLPNNGIPVKDFIQVPIIGRIPAGSPLIAIENIEGFEDIPRSWLNGEPKNFFILKVDGDSMEGARIYDGDLALIKKCPTCDNGQICAVGITGETPDLYATLKRVYELDEEYLELVPENSKYPRRKVKRSEVNIFGVLKRTIRVY